MLPPRDPDIIDRHREHERRIRRLEVRKQPTPPGLTGEELTIPLGCFNTGWSPGDTAADSGLTPRAWKMAGRVWLSGTIDYAGSGDPENPLIDTPAGFVPLYLANCAVHVDDDNSVGTTQGKRFIGELLSTGTVWLTLDPHPDFGSGPPSGTSLILDGISYRV